MSFTTGVALFKKKKAQRILKIQSERLHTKQQTPVPSGKDLATDRKEAFWTKMPQTIL